MKIEDLKIFCTDWLSSWTGNQPQQLLSFYASQAYYRDPAKPEGLRGHAQLKPYLEKLLAKNPNWIWTAQEIIPTEKGFTLKWKAQIPKASEIIIEEGLDLVEIENGKIIRNEVFFDPSKLK
ncbi:MAG: nuclear transport factor 2 family protein [Deltaproteobacteria bacterium]|nr:nuclear transport factor 2 family protein [Deltaproteobacteria bacterium]